MISDDRRPPFCFQTHDALDAIRERYAGAKRTTALAIYLALTETANRYGGAAARENFRASRKEIGDRAGVSVDTLDRYVAEFVEVGILIVLRERVGAANLPNRWSLVTLERTGAPPSRTGAATDGVAPSRTGAAQVPRTDLERKETTTREAAVPELGQVDRKPVALAHAALAVAVLAEWNQQTGQHIRSRDWLVKFVMRIREYPELTIDDHAHVIAASLASPWWKGAPTPSVVYGSGAQFERSIETAKAGPQVDPPRRGPGGARNADELLEASRRLTEAGL